MPEFARKYNQEKFGKVCVLGLGKTGISVVNYFLTFLGSRVDSIHVYAGDKSTNSMKAADKLLARGATVSFDDKSVEGSYDLCVVSPGISNLSELYKSAIQNCIEVISEVELAWRESEKDSIWIAITGTNGKTTTTSLVSHILKLAGKRAASVGNIGNVAIDEVSNNKSKSIFEQTDIYVLEISSYQLASTIQFAPNVAALINITPDHILWHGSFDNYAKAKMKIFERAKIAVYDDTDKEASKRCKSLGLLNSIETITKLVPNEEIIEVKNNGIAHRIIDCESVQLFGMHNYANCCIAAAICLNLGLTETQIATGLATFKPLEHRLEPCGVVRGINFFNDSKATNVDAVLVAIKSFPGRKAIFLLGGRDKNTDLDELVWQCSKHLRGVVCYGEAGERFYDAFKNNDKGDGFILLRAEKLSDALALAVQHSSVGQSIVLSPACASFDEFSCFEQRGDFFKKLILG